MHVLPWPRLHALRTVLVVLLVALLALAAFAAGAELMPPAEAPVTTSDAQPQPASPDLTPAPVLLR